MKKGQGLPPPPAVVAVVAAGREKKAISIAVLDLREVASFTDYFVIMTGTSQRQVQAIAEGGIL